MKKKVVILIDGQNLYYNLKGLGLVEKNIKWGDLLQSLITSDDELIRTYWFRPPRILDTYFTSPNIRKDIVFKKYRTHFDNYKNNKAAIPESVLNDIEIQANSVESWLRDEKKKFSGIEYAYDQLTLEFEDIEIVKTGIVKVNPFTQEYIGEKGVDIALAVKMISLCIDNKCDKIILVSGDYDYAEAIRYVKDKMKKIHIVKLHKGIPPKNKSVSRDLAVLADKVIDIYEADLRALFVKTV